MSEDFKDPMGHSVERALTTAVINKIQDNIWKRAKVNSQGEKVLVPNPFVLRIVWYGFYFILLMFIGLIILGLFTDEEVGGYEVYLFIGGVLLLFSYILILFKRSKIVVNDTTVKVYAMFKVQEIHFSEIEKVTHKSFPVSFILHSSYRKRSVRMPASYEGTGEFITILYNKIGYEKSLPAILYRDMNKDRFRR